MKDYYTINDIASICDVDQETVRRWYRKGLLGKSTTDHDGQGTRKQIAKENLMVFLTKHPKYQVHMSIFENTDVNGQSETQSNSTNSSVDILDDLYRRLGQLYMNRDKIDSEIDSIKDVIRALEH